MEFHFAFEMKKIKQFVYKGYRTPSVKREVDIYFCFILNANVTLMNIK